MHLTVQGFGPSAWVLTEVLGFRRTSEHAESGKRVVLFEVGSGDPGAEVRLIEELDAPRAHLGRGRGHHVAFGRPTTRSTPRGAPRDAPRGASEYLKPDSR